MKRLKSLPILLVLACLLLALSACGDSEGAGTATVSDAPGPRSARSSTSPMGEDGTWTVFVYMCGSDLESENGMGGMDMEEMAAASTGENVRFVVETGGANSWENDVSSDQLGRYVISDGQAELVDSEDNANMGDSSTLADFLKWGVQNYPAANMGLVLWDHGGGSIGGVCYDEKSDYDSLRLKELDAALCSVRGQMTEPFEFIGLDACLMGTIETANLMSAHANYLVASEETEPGYGWDYTAIGDYLGENPEANGADLGKVICDSFYASCEAVDSQNGATLSVVDLTKIGQVTSAFDAYAKDIYDMTEQGSEFKGVAREIASADNYGGNNRSEGYTNMVDLAGIVAAGKDDSGNAQAVLDAIDSAVVYKKNGSDHPDASGLSSYYPLQVQGSEELKVFKDICVSPSYLGLVDKVAKGHVDAGSIDGYDNTELVEQSQNDWTGDDYTEDEEGNYSYDEGAAESESFWDFLDEPTEEEGESSAISFAAEPKLDDEGTFGFTLSEDGLENAESVEALVFMGSDQENEIICIGETTDVNGDWETGEFTDNFDGSWFSLADGQVLSTYIVGQADGYVLFTTPVLLNGEQKYLRFMWDYQSGEVTILDVWDGIDQASGAAGRQGQKLKAGDKVVPLYDSYDLDGNDLGPYQGSEYVYADGDQISFGQLFDGDYYYSFSIDDIYGNYLLTDVVSFSVSGDEVTFSV